MSWFFGAAGSGFCTFVVVWMCRLGPHEIARAGRAGPGTGQFSDIPYRTSVLQVHFLSAGLGCRVPYCSL